MARSALTLAASVTAALPRVGVAAAAVLTEGALGRYDAALVHLDDGRQVVVRVPTDAAAAAELGAEARALRALTPGVRAILPFRAPALLGEAALGDRRTVVVDHLPGYRVDAPQLPAGDGAAVSIGAALAAVHALPAAVLRTEGLAVLTCEQQRSDVSRLVDRVAATDAVPESLLARWRRAVHVEALWRFESAVVLGGANADSFLLEDSDSGPFVTGVLEWHGLSLGDPAIDLRWLASAPAAADDVFAAYTAAAHRAPDAGLRARARLYAELEFAKWLLHGVDDGRDDVIGDAVALLSSLADGVRDDDLFAEEELDVDDAIALLDRTPSADLPAVDTSMQTDAYDPGMLSMFVSAEDADEAGTADTAGAAGAGGGEDVSTAPIDISAWATARTPDAADDGADHGEDADRAARATLNRWASSAWE